MIGALHKRNSCITLHPPGGHYSRRMSKSSDTSSTSSEPRNTGTSVSVKRCHSSSKAEKQDSSPPITLKERIYNDLRSVAENLCLIESMVPCMRTEDDSQELVKRLRGTNRILQQILPSLHSFMTLPSPLTKEEKERFQYERKKLAREFEAALSSYKHCHKTLHTSIKNLKADVAL